MAASFDKRNPLQLKQIDEDDEVDSNDQESLLLRQDIEGSRPKHKRNEVRYDFDSDSSDDGKTRRNRARKVKKNDKRRKEEEGEEDGDDMFSDEDDVKENDEDVNDSDAERKESKKKAKFLDMEKFEKEEEIELEEGVGEVEEVEEQDDDSGSDSDSDSDINESNVDINYFVNPDVNESEVENPNRKLKNAKKAEPKLESFHLRTDLEDGNFDQDGNFIRNAMDENAHQDSWLDGLNKHDIKAARKAHLYREKLESELVDNEFIPKCDIIIKLVDCLEIGESPLEALQRLNKKAPRSKKVKGKSGVNKELGLNGDSKEQHRISSIEIITDCCNKLLQDFSINDIYDITREELLREYQKETGEAYIDLKRKRIDEEDEGEVDNDTQWEFKWEGSDEIHGPYTSENMSSWVEYNYFDERVSVRRVTNPPSDFVPYNEVTF